MSPIAEVRWVAQRELLKSFRSAKGIVLLVLSLLGGSAISMIVAFVQKAIREKLLGNIPPETVHALTEEAYTNAFGDERTGKTLASIPELVLTGAYVTVWLTPLVVSLLGFDGISGDLQHRTVRYWSLRTRRASYVVGKWLGLWGTTSAITLTMHVLLCVICIARGQGAADVTVRWALQLWLLALPIGAAWAALATLVSSLMRTPILALLTTFAVFFALFVAYLVGSANDVTALVYLYPNAYSKLLVDQRVPNFAKGLGACLAMATVYLGATTFAFTKRDV